MTLNLFDSPSGAESWQERLGPGAVMLRGFAASDETTLLAALRGVIAMAPFRHMVTPGGFRMSVAMTNCGSFGWITDRTGELSPQPDYLHLKSWRERFSRRGKAELP
jgi:alkylated DNA repair protein (DNA oxidative demethylase)